MSESKLVSCRHCGNISKMEIIGNVSEDQSTYDPDYGCLSACSTTYSVLKCPACEKVNIVTYFSHEDMESEEEISYEFLFPQNPSYPLGLPEKILNAYKEAEKAKTTGVNAYAVLMRKLLEMVCLDKGASSKKTLFEMLKELADKNEIPKKLVDVANGLRDFGNIGAHAGSGELTEREIPIVSALGSAILEYLYSAPYLATLAENKLESIRVKSKIRSKLKE